MRISVAIPFSATDDSYRVRSYERVCAQWRDLGEDVEVITADSGRPFNRSAARNAAVRQARHDVVAIVDADTVFVDPDAVRAAYRYVRAHPQHWALPHTTYWTATPAFTTQWWTDPTTPIGASHTFEHRFTDNICGVLIMSQAVFHTVGGYDERFRGWGYEDNAFACALHTLVGPPQRMPGDVIHLWHPRPEGDFSQPYIAHNQQLWARYQSAASDPVAMRALVDNR